MIAQMKPYSYDAVACVIFLIVISSQAIADLSSDRQALLDFATIVRHGRKLNWNSSTNICTSWVGVSCTNDASRVLAVRVPGAGFSGLIPPNTLGKLDALTILSLRANKLGGELPPDLLSLPSIRYIYLQENNFSGTVPSSLSSQLIFLDLSFNSFTGNIPTTIKNLTLLVGLNLQNNSFTGPIPGLNLPRLRNLNLSNNNLNGSIPSTLRKFSSSSFTGNSLLCGPPLNGCSITTPIPSPSPSPSYFSPEKPEEVSNERLSKGAISAIAVGVSILLFLLLITVFCCLKKNDGEGIVESREKSGWSEKPKDFNSGVQDAEKNKLVFFGGCSYNFDLDDLLRASAEVLGKGSYGTTYKAILEEGTAVVVKRLKELVVGKREFEQQMEAVGMLGQHPHLVPLRAYYYSKDEKLLVYECIPGGSFSTLLHGSRGSGHTPLDWDSRVRICLGAAKGIASIHSASGGKFIHGNIRSSNVLLAQDLQGCVSDFGLAPLMNLVTVPSRSAGYRAPEVIEARKYTQKSDVYSFGVLLLETLTGKAPVPTPGHEDVVDLPKWVHSVVREEWTAEVFDVELMRYQNIEEEMVQMLQIAMSCVASMPEMRPTMDEVVRLVEEIRPVGSGNRSSSEDNISKGSNTPTPE